MSTRRPGQTPPDAAPPELEYYLAVPYVVALESVPVPGGSWIRQASHPELPGCRARADDPQDAIGLLEGRKKEWLTRALARGERIPVPRPPLNEGHFALRRAPGHERRHRALR